MNRLENNQLTPQVRALFEGDYPGGLRCMGVLDGLVPGDMWVDDRDQPTWGFVREKTYGTLFPGGEVDWSQLTATIQELRPNNETLLGVWQQDAEAIKAKLPPPNYEGTVLDYTNRPIGNGLDELLQAIPEGCDLRRVDADLFDQLSDREGILAMFGSKEKALTTTFGSCLLIDGVVVSEAFGAPPIRGVIEAGVGTHPDHRRKGYATLTSAHLIQLCENAGYSTYWNINAMNTPSVALAKKLGYQTERPYTLFAWFDEN